MHSVRFTKDKIPQAPFFKGDLYLLWILGSPNSELNYMFIPQHITGNSYHKTATCGGNHATSSAGGIDSGAQQGARVYPALAVHRIA
jgi:hypothetical protein